MPENDRVIIEDVVPVDTTTVNVEGTEYTLNDAGDALTAEGDVFKTKAELDAFVTPPVTPEQQEVDGVMYNLDDKGNALDSNNEVKFTKDELIALKEETDAVTELDIDGTVYKLDKDGNAVDGEGNVAHTAEAIIKMAEAEDDVTIVTPSQIAEKTNLNILDAGGNTVEYSNDEAGLVEYANDIHDLGLKTGATDYEKNMFDVFPILRQIIPHLQSSNGTLDGFNDTVDYSTIKLDKDNVSQLKNIIFTARLKRGENEDSVDKYYSYLQKSSDDNDEVLKEAESSLKFLSDTQVSETKSKQTLIDNASADNLANMKKYWGVEIDDKGKLINLNVDGSVRGIITNGKLTVGDDSYTIPERINVKVNDKVVHKTRDDFFNYLFTPRTYQIDNQRITMTQDEYNIEVENTKRKVDDDIYNAFRRFTGYDDAQIIKDKVEMSKVNTVRRLVSSGKRGGNTKRKSNDEIVLSPRN